MELFSLHLRNACRRQERSALVPWTSRDQRYQRHITEWVTNPQIRTMWHRILTVSEIPEYRHNHQFRRRTLDGSDPTPTRVNQDLTPGACRTATAHCGPAYGASSEAARSADSARTGHRAQNTLVWLIRPATTQRFLPGFGVSPRGAHRAHPDLSVPTAPSAHLSCGAIGGPVHSKSVPRCDRAA